MSAVSRRAFLVGGAKGLAALRLGAPAAEGVAAGAPTFHTDDEHWLRTYDAALRVLAGNVRELPHYPHPVLIEGASYAGIWQECGPHEALVYRKFRPDVARHSHLTFFALQRPDGQLPANNKLTETGFGQIQMVVPIAATAWDVARATRDSELLERAYTACSGWDAWLLRYRNTRGTGLTEGFCTYDTGHDNSPRWAGIPPQCPGKDARRFPPIASLPRLCPDLSATVYGARVALADMARALGKSADEDRWLASAETMRRLILEKLYVEADAAFYDLDAENRFVRIRCDILSRMCGEHVPDQRMFDQLWSRQLHNPSAFWAPFPLPSVALDELMFVRPIPRNSWGGASQALTALRAGRWFDHYRRSAEFGQMMQQWCKAMVQQGEFRQQIDPLTGEFTQADAASYSPAALVFLDYTWRLAGVRDELAELHWNVRPGIAAAKNARYTVTTDAGSVAELTYTAAGAQLTLAGQNVGTVSGGAVRVVTDRKATVLRFLGIAETVQKIAISRPGHHRAVFAIKPNQELTLSGSGVVKYSKDVG